MASIKKLSTDLEKVVRVMKQSLQKWQSAKDEKSKERWLKTLKKLTKTKSKLEKKLESAVSDVDSGVELNLTEARRWIRKEIKNILFINEDQYTRVAITDEQEEAVSNVVDWLTQLNVRPSKALLTPEVPISWNPDVIIDLKYQGSEVRVNTDGEIVAYGEPVNDLEDLEDIIGREYKGAKRKRS